MTGTPHPPMHLASALLDATLIVVGAERHALQAYAERLGAVLEEPAGRDTYPLLLQFWNVSEGRMRPFGIDSNAWWDLLGATWGGSVSRLMYAVGNEWAVKTFGAYHEFLCGIPDVRAHGSSEPSLLIERMYTDSPFARIVDKALGYGFGKQAALFGVSPGETRLSMPSGRSLASFRITAPLQAVSDEHVDLLPRIERWLRQHLLGRTTDGRLVLSQLSWAPVDPLTPVSVELRLGQPLSALLPREPCSADGSVPGAVGFRQRSRVEITPPSVVGGAWQRQGVSP